MSFAWLWGSDELADVALELIVTSTAAKDGDFSGAEEHSMHSRVSTHVLALHASLLASCSPYFRSRLTTWRKQHALPQDQQLQQQAAHKQRTRRGCRGRGRKSKGTSQIDSKVEVQGAPQNAMTQTPTDSGASGSTQSATSFPGQQPAGSSQNAGAAPMPSVPQIHGALEPGAPQLRVLEAVSATVGPGAQQNMSSAASEALPQSSPPPPPPPPSSKSPAPVTIPLLLSSTPAPWQQEPRLQCPVLLSHAEFAEAEDAALQHFESLEAQISSYHASCSSKASSSSSSSSSCPAVKVTLLDAFSEVDGLYRRYPPIFGHEAAMPWVRCVVFEAAAAVRRQLQHNEEYQQGMLTALLKQQMQDLVRQWSEGRGAQALQLPSVAQLFPADSIRAPSAAAILGATYLAGRAAAARTFAPLSSSAGANGQGPENTDNIAPMGAAGAATGMAALYHAWDELRMEAQAAKFRYRRIKVQPDSFASRQAIMSAFIKAGLPSMPPCSTTQPSGAIANSSSLHTTPQTHFSQRPVQYSQSHQQHHDRQQPPEQHTHKQQAPVTRETVHRSIILASGVRLHSQHNSQQSSPQQQQQQQPRHWIQLQEHCTEEQLPGLLGVLRYMYTGQLPAAASLEDLVPILLHADYWSVIPCITACVKAIVKKLETNAVPLDQQCANMLSLLPPHLFSFYPDPQDLNAKTDSSPDAKPGNDQQQQPQQQVQVQQRPVQVNVETATEQCSEDAAWQEPTQVGKLLTKALHQRLLSAFGKAAAVARSSKLLNLFVALPYVFVHVWASLPDVRIDSEHTIVLLLSRWVEAQQQGSQHHVQASGQGGPTAQPPAPQQLAELSELVRQSLLTSSFILQVLPHLHWYQPPAGEPSNTAQVMAQLSGGRLQRMDWEQLLSKRGVVRRSQPGSTLITHVSEDVLHNAWRAAPRGGTARIPLSPQYWGGYVWKPYLFMSHTRADGEEEPAEPAGLGIFSLGIQLTCDHVPWLDALKAPDVLNPVAGLQLTVEVGNACEHNVEYLLGGEPVGPKDVMDGEYFMDVQDLMNSHGDNQGKLKVVLCFQSVT